LYSSGEEYIFQAKNFPVWRNLSLVYMVLNPYLFNDENGDLVGPDMEIWKMFAKQHDLQFTPKEVKTFNEVTQAVSN